MSIYFRKREFFLKIDSAVLLPIIQTVIWVLGKHFGWF